MENLTPTAIHQQSSPTLGVSAAAIQPARTFGAVMEQHRGAGPGFDAIRIGLSLMILLSHSINIAYGSEFAKQFYTHSLWYPILLSLVPAFFCLSGFLVTGSAFRTRSVPVFLTHRLLRIYPALTVEITLTALILGPLITSLPLAQYFTDPVFFEYFGSLIGRVKFDLPGLFLDNPLPTTVNQNLWTLKAEFYCYLVMVVLMLSGLAFKRALYCSAFGIATLILIALNFRSGFGDYDFLFPPHVLLYYFLLGMACYQIKDRIPLSLPLFVASAVVAYLLIPAHGFAYLAAFPLTYCVLYVGMLRIPRIPFLQNGDYSYGIYLFGFPIQQTLAKFFPALHVWWSLFLVSACITILFAAGSWHLVEKPTLKLKKFFLPARKPVAS